MIKKNLLWVQLKLTKFPEYRDSNARLYYAYLRDHGYNIDNSIKDFLKDMEKGVIPHMDSIGRTSRKIQEEYPNLRGEFWGKRKQKAVKIKHEILHDC